MQNCVEHDLSKLAGIIAYPCGTLGFTSPVYVLDPVQSPTGEDSDSRFRVRFTRDTAKCTDRNTASVAGYLHTVTLEWETQGVEQADFDQYVGLQNTPHEFVLHFFGGLRKVIRTAPTSYQFLFNEDNGTMKCSVTLINGQGLTLIG